MTKPVSSEPVKPPVNPNLPANNNNGNKENLATTVDNAPLGTTQVITNK
jgi:hypothetical protein